MRVKVRGPSWRRESGEIVPHGGTFTPTDSELALLWRTQAFALQTVQRIDDGPVAPPPALVRAGGRTAVAGAVQTKVAVQVEAGKWPLVVTPLAYLQRHPNGKHAALARQILGPEVSSG